MTSDTSLVSYKPFAVPQNTLVTVRVRVARPTRLRIQSANSPLTQPGACPQATVLFVSSPPSCATPQKNVSYQLSGSSTITGGSKLPSTVFSR